MIAIKCKIQNKINITKYLKQYNNVVRFSHNRFQDNKDLSLSQCEKIVKKTMNNINDLDSSILKCAVNKAKSIPQNNIIFGGKLGFNKLKYKKNNYTREEYVKHRNESPMLLRGSSCDNNGNRKARLNIIENNSVILKLNKKEHIEIQLPRLSKNNKSLLYKLQEKCENNNGCFSLEVNNDFVYIIFDEILVKNDNDYNKLKNRVLSFDMNPNYIGLSVIDWVSEENKKVISKEIIDIKNIKDDKKRKHEMMEISKYISNLAKHYQCESVVFEKLDIKSSDKKKGKKFNKLCNNDWIKNAFISNVKKRCNIQNTNVIEVLPHYSSFIGQLMNPNDYDSVAASIEISRRGYKFKQVFIDKTDLDKNIIFPRFNVGSLATHWKEMLLNNSNDIETWKDLYDIFKKSKTSYRFLFNKKQFLGNSLRLFSVKSNVYLHETTQEG